MGVELIVGDHTYAKPAVLGVFGRVIVGRFCSIAHGVTCCPCYDHRVDWVSTYPFKGLWKIGNDGHPGTRGPIVIGNDVWIGRAALILSGVSIGDGAVVGASAVVARDVRPYAVVVGNPAREVRRRFTDEQVAGLLRVRWWDWPVEKIREHAGLLTSGDVDAFLKEAGA